LASSGLRQRLAAIVAADAAGYSKLMSLDERGTLVALDAGRAVFKDQIESHQGRVIDMAGDSVLAVFETATGAVSAALTIQENLAVAGSRIPHDQRLQFRIGIHLGDVIEKPDGTIYGDGVNIAARVQALATPGGIAISAMVREAVRGRLDDVFEDGGEHSVKNIGRPIRIFRKSPGVSAAPAIQPGPALPSRPSIAVLPFDNMSVDAEQGFFADGMTEDIITLLSRVPELFVIARNSTFAYKGRAVDIRQVAAELGVRYVLEGSVRKAGDRIRITAQFIDAETGNHIWAERYDRQLEDIFAVQDEVGQGIVSTLQSRLLHAEFQVARRRPPEALDAWGNVVRAKVKLFAYRRQDLDEAEPFARKAVESDPSYGEAHSTLGHLLAWRSYNGWCPDWHATAKEAVLHLDRASQLSPQDPTVLADIGFGSWVLGRFLKAVPPLERALQLNPNSAATAAAYGLAIASVGRPEEGIEKIRLALRLSPKDPLEHLFHSYLAHAEFFGARYDDARRSAERALQASPDLVHALVIHAAACVRSGDRGQAEQTLKKVDRLSAIAIDNLFRPRTDGTLWGQYTAAMREAMGREPRV
jgi:adenylate cyclase